MIRAVATGKNGIKLLLLGLDRENVRRLTAGEPIFVEGAELGVPLVDVFLIFGESLQDVVDQLTAAGIDFPKGDG